MLHINYGSVIRSGTVAAALAGLLLLIALTPFANNVLLALLVAGLVAIPFGAGIYYGRVSPGHETMAQSAVGGALSGLVAGILLGIAFGINQATLTAVSTYLPFLTAIASGLAVTIIAGGILGVIGAILGAVGGVLWQVVQPSDDQDPAGELQPEAGTSGQE